MANIPKGKQNVTSKNDNDGEQPALTPNTPRSIAH